MAEIGVKHSQTQSGHGALESEIAMEAATSAVRHLIDRGVLGHGTFDVSITGHSNPGKQPAVGWSNDYLNIQIQQRSMPPGA